MSTDSLQSCHVLLERLQPPLGLLVGLLVCIVWLVADVGNVADQLILVVGLPERLVLNDVVVFRQPVVQLPLIEAAVHRYDLRMVLSSFCVCPSDASRDQVSVIVAVKTAVKHVFVARVIALMVGLLLNLVLFNLEIHGRLVFLPPLDLALVSGSPSIVWRLLPLERLAYERLAYNVLDFVSELFHQRRPLVNGELGQLVSKRLYSLCKLLRAEHFSRTQAFSLVCSCFTV